MKRILLFILLLSSSWIVAQPSFGTVISALKSGNVPSIGNYMAPQVELAMDGQNGTYDKAQAMSTITQFFDQNPPSSCSMMHSGAARDGGSHYCIGSLKAGSKKYRVYLFFKKLEGAYKIQEMRMTAE